MKTYTNYRDALSSALSQRKMLLRTQRSMKDAQRMAQTCMLVESFLQRIPSNESVKKFVQTHYARVVDLVPRRTANDSRVQLFQKLANA
jgi:hypothetical protein